MSVDEFFDAQKSEYGERYEALSRVHHENAKTISDRAIGKVASIGGLWPGYSRDAAPRDLAVVDVSKEMLSMWEGCGAELIHADARDLPFEARSLDSIVYPMILHHVCEGTAASAQQGVKDCFAEAARVLKPNGTVIILDYTISEFVYRTELLLSGITKWLLSLSDIPLVVMHNERFYRQSLSAAGFGELENITIGGKGKPMDLIRPVIGLPWLVIPRFIYPVRPMLLTARNMPDCAAAPAD